VLKVCFMSAEGQ